MLIEAGADVSVCNSEMMAVLAQHIPVYLVGSRTPLHYAAEQGHLGCVRFIHPFIHPSNSE